MLQEFILILLGPKMSSERFSFSCAFLFYCMGTNFQDRRLSLSHRCCVHYRSQEPASFRHKPIEKLAKFVN